MKIIILPILLITVSKCLCAVEISDRSRNFSIELLHFTQLETDGHVVISPFGIWTLMTGVAIGATENSYTELKRAFILPKNPAMLIKQYQNLTKSVLEPTTTGVSLTSKNFVFLDNGFSVYPQFRATIHDDFQAAIKVIDFKDPNSAARTANNYIGQNSGGRVSNVLQSSDFAESRMILTNVISFKGLWTFPFNKSETVTQPFYNENKEVIGEVNMMYQRAAIPYSNFRELRAFVIELPYGNDDRYSMLILLPHNNVKIADMYKNLVTVSLKDVFKRLQNDTDEFGLTEIDVQIPRFQISTNVVMNQPLNNMGVVDIFQPDSASFKKVTPEKIYVSAIVHKAEIEVTESGTVATAVTSALFADRISTPKFHANRPFVYFVMEKTTTTMIFGGIYSVPTLY